jgi:hypothetical protein
MIRNPQEILRVKRNYERKQSITLVQKYTLLNEMYREVQLLGRLTVKRSNEQQHKVALARMLNAGI